MSKSSPSGCVFLLDDEKVSEKKIKSAVTDSDREIRFDPEAKPGVSNLLTLQQAITDAPMDDIVAGYVDRGYGDLKKETAEVVLSAVGPIRDRTRDFLADPAELLRLMGVGADKAREAAAPTLEAVYSRVGFVRS